MRIRTQLLLFTGIVTIIVLCGFLAWHLRGPRIVGRAVAPDGTEMCIVQRCNWSAEPFTTAFVFRKPGQPWGWCYYDHEDNYWGVSTVELDTNKGIAVFYRGTTPAVTFEWATENYTLHRWERVTEGPQTRLPAGSDPLRSRP